MTEDIDDELREAICNSIPYVNNQVVQAAMDGDFSNSPQWIWRNHENGCVGFGRWPHHPDAAPYIRADLIVAVLARMATSHALGFKAGIEAGAAIAQRCMDDEDEKAAADRSDDIEVFGKRLMAFGTAQVIRDEILSLPTPPSILPEILEAMRPVAEIAEKDIGDDERDVDIFRDMQTHNRAPRLTVGHLRTLAAMFTKLGGKIDA